jgi:signal transduction histidine kinase/DNA-binding response OmpR family regulator
MRIIPGDAGASDYNTRPINSEQLPRNKGAEFMPDDAESNVQIAEEERHGREHVLLNAINRVFREALTCENDKQVARQCLAVAEELTASKFGFIGELNKEGQLDTIALSDPGWSACNIPEADALAMLRNMPIRGIWSTALRAGQSQIINDPASHPDRVGTPQGHPPIDCFLGVPLVRGDKIVGLIALANKPGRYNPDDQQAIEALSVSFVEALLGKRAEVDLHAYATELEQSNRELKDHAMVIAAKTQALQERAIDLETAMRAKDEFLANMSHELRTPLNAVIGFSEGLLERADRHLLNEHQKDRISKIKKSGEYLLILINRVLDLSSVEAGKTQVNPTSFDLETLINEMSGIAEELIKNKPQVRYAIDLEKGLPPIVSDRDILKQILINLISNAAKFTEQGSIKLWVRRDFRTILLSVEDTGMGIPDKHIDHVFEKFYQVPETMRGSLKGTGLGLSICKKYGSLLGGTLTVRSIEGQGSAFTLCVPIIFDEEQRQKKTQLIEEVRVHCLAFPADESRSKVLCIEPEPTNVLLLNDILIEARYQVIPAFDGAEGLYLATTMHPQVIILNVTLPGLDGWEVLHRIKANPATCDIPIIIACTVEEKKLGLYFGASDFLVKPVDKARLLEALSRVSARARMGKCAVAIVDDDVDILKITAEALEKEGYRTSTFISGDEFLANLQKQRPDVVILDLLMPHLDGFQVLNALLNNPDWAKIPVVVMTAKVLSTEELAVLNNHVRAVIQKSGITHEEAYKHLTEQLKLLNKKEPAYETDHVG